MTKYLFILVAVLFSLSSSWGQGSAKVFGVITDLDTKEVIDFATVYIKDSNTATETNAFGEYSLTVPAGQKLVLVVSRIGYKETEYKIKKLPADGKRNINVKLVSEVSELEIVIRDSKIEDVGMVREEVTEFKKLPTASGNFESILPHIALGASGGTGGELRGALKHDTVIRCLQSWIFAIRGQMNLVLLCL